jgi:eukaryotic-like serine/threonine-protein kinase
MDDPQEIDEVLFETALGIDEPASREAFFDLIRDGDPSRSERLRTLASVHMQADRFFRKAEGARTIVATEAGEELIDLTDPTALEETPRSTPSEGPGERIGRYRLEKRIGEGGCGVVYLAEQLEPVRRKVALKVIRLGMDTERVIERFEMERQSLALMDHPNIARVLDGGATDSGRPYFVMEWVRGARITDYCDVQELSLRKRIDLFIEVCKGIQHAHQKGVIHRDIKPSNILIDESGGHGPKIIDFGIAKAISGNDDLGTQHSSQDQFVGTPAYMSPEQAVRRERDIDTRSDVYSLGMLLYELLAGRTPFDSAELASVGLMEMRRILLEREPPVPSALFSGMSPEDQQEIAAHRKCEPAKLPVVLKGDLDSVVMKAIEKDRSRRYETVNGLVMDLQRYLAHEPVIARPAKRAYVFRKFVRRNRVAVTAGSGIVLSLLLGMGTAYTYYLREREALDEQVRLRKFADAAHANELMRIEEARGWEDFAHVSVLLSEGRTEEADEQLRATPIASIRLSPQSSVVLRSLGNWNALRGRWPQATECFMMMMKTDDMNRGQNLTTSLDLVAISSVLIEGGKPHDYRAFQAWATDRYGSTSSAPDASRLLHAILLAPVDPQLLNRLEALKPMMQEFEEGIELEGYRRERELAQWRAFGLALLEYRQGNYQQAKRWSDFALSFKESRDYIRGALEPVHAMICFQLGDLEAAREDLGRCRKRIEKAFSPELPAAYEPFGQYQGFWWDWIIARTLFREAESVISVEGEGG